MVGYVCWFFRPLAALLRLALVALSYAAVLVIQGVETDAIAGYASAVGTSLRWRRT